MKPIFIIEHREPQLWPWCIIEYESISKIVGKNNVWFTNIKKRDVSKLTRYGRVYTQSLRNLAFDPKEICVLDPLAPKTLTPKDARTFHYFVLGGILGDVKLNGRTKKEVSSFMKKSPQRNIGKKQFSTDNAVYVTHEIANGTPLQKMNWQDTLELHFNSIESVILPYRYPLVHGKPRISPKLITYLKNKQEF